MGQNESRQSDAHRSIDDGLPETGNSGLLKLPPAHRPRRNSADGVEISQSVTKARGRTARRMSADVTISPPDSFRSSKSPGFSLRRLHSKQTSEFNLPIVVPCIVEVPALESRRQSVELGPINMKSPVRKPTFADLMPRIPKHEIYVSPPDNGEDNSPPDTFRSRASTIGHAVRRHHRSDAIESAVSEVMGDRKKVEIPTVLRFSTARIQPKPSRVYVAGSMTKWETVEMANCSDEADFNVVVNCAPGTYHYKFCVAGEWCVDETQQVVSTYVRKSSWGSPRLIKANTIVVKAEDLEVFEALACDSFAVKPGLAPGTKPNSWTQERPSPAETSSSSPSGPPILPPHLLNILLNKDVEERSDPILLPEPCSHVMVNHLFAQSIRDNTLVLASTTRFRKKYITMLYYRPI